MDRRSLIKYMSMCTVGGVFSLSFPSLRAAIASQSGPEWGYEGENGPQLWSELSSDFRVCGVGRQQSPIDLQGAVPSEVADFQLSYQEIPLKVLNNGHTIQVNAEPGNQLNLGGKDFELLQFHFHHPSEHTTNNQPYPMEVHFVHQNAQGELAVLGVFMEEGEENEGLKPIWDAMPGEETSEQTIEGVKVNMSKLLPDDQSSYRYFGSLTTPPCSEIVRWVVLQKPIAVSKGQIQKLSQIFPGNARPTQPRNRRFLLQSN